MHIRRLLSAAVVMLLMSATLPLYGAIDSTLFTTYTMDAKRTTLNWVVCGSTQFNSGCYSVGALGPFGRVGAMIEGIPSQDRTKGTVTRYIYILDVAYGSGGNGVGLYVYKKVDTVTPSDDTATITLFKTVTLPLTGGSATVASLAANQAFLYIGTNQDDLAVQMKKNNFAVTQFGEVSGPAAVTAITADQYGYVTVTWKTPSGSEAFSVMDPTGRAQEGGGGGSFMLNTVQAVQPTALP